MAQSSCLLAYTSVHGNTLEIVSRIAAGLRDAGLAVQVCDLAHDRPDPADHDLVVAGGSVHRGKHRPELLAWLDDHRGVLAACPTELFTVSLMASGSSDADRAAVRRYEDDLRGRVAVHTRVTAVAGALQYREYGLPTRWMMRMIARRHGLPTDTSQDHVLTDWDAVDRFAAEAVVRGRPPVPA